VGGGRSESSVVGSEGRAVLWCSGIVSWAKDQEKYQVLWSCTVGVGVGASPKREKDRMSRARRAESSWGLFDLFERRGGN
jgi:hypothetical protein